MKLLPLLIFVVFLTACKKEERYGPFKLKNGQEVELLVDHRYGSDDQKLLILPQNKPIDIPLYAFQDRKPGYSYRVKAKLIAEKNPPADGPDKWFELTKVISEEKYQKKETFTVSLIQGSIPGGPVITLIKKNGQYHFFEDKLLLTYANETVKNQLEEIWLHAQEIRENRGKDPKLNFPKWKSIKATVTHDPNNFGKAYLVQRIEFSL